MIILDEVSKSFGNHMAVNRVTLTIPDRAQIALLGPSGSGKTTLLRLIAGLEMPDSGLISMNGRVVSSPGILYPHMSEISVLRSSQPPSGLIRPLRGISFLP